MTENKITRGTVAQNGLIDIELIQTGQEIEIKIYSTLTLQRNTGEFFTDKFLMIHDELYNHHYVKVGLWDGERVLEPGIIGVVRGIKFKKQKQDQSFSQRLRQALKLILNRS